MKDMFATLVNAILEVVKSYKGDWKENDPSSPNYIKNRTHWVDKKTIDRIALNETITLNGENYEMFKTSLYLDMNGTYYVTFNGVEYICKPWTEGMSPNGMSSSDPTIYIGNGDVYGGEGLGNLDCPFSFDSYIDGTIYLNMTVTSGEYTVQIREVKTEETIHKLDEKFLPTNKSNNSTITLKLNNGELNFIKSYNYGKEDYNDSLEYIQKSDLYKIYSENINTVIFEGYENYPFKVVGAYLGFNNRENIILQTAICDSSDDGYVNYRIMLSYSDDMGSCYMSSYFGDYSYLPEQMYFDSNGCLIITINGETQKFEPVQKPV